MRQSGSPRKTRYAVPFQGIETRDFPFCCYGQQQKSAEWNRVQRPAVSVYDVSGRENLEYFIPLIPVCSYPLEKLQIDLAMEHGFAAINRVH